MHTITYHVKLECPAVYPNHRGRALLPFHSWGPDIHVQTNHLNLIDQHPQTQLEELGDWLVCSVDKSLRI